MSSNQKQTVSGGPQTQRYCTSPYQPISQTNSRADGFTVPTPPATYVPQPNQGGNQGPGLRGIAPTGPPNQASTPPNTDIKVPTLSQQPLNHMFVQRQVRPPQGTYYATRSTGPPSQTQRMPNHNNRSQQPIYGNQPPYVQVPQTYLVPSPFYNTSQRPPNFGPPQNIVYTGPPIATYNAFPTPSQTQSIPFYIHSQTMIPRPGSIPQPQPPTPNPSPAALANVSMVQSGAPLQHFPRTIKRRPNALAIVDPKTGIDQLDEIFADQSHPPSGESSACQTPQPNSHSHNKEVQATFAKQVMQAINVEYDCARIEEPELYHHPPADGTNVEQTPYPIPIQQAVPPSNIDQIVQSSKLQATAKDFAPNTSKEPPVVSANCDAVEVTLTNRESPIKGRKQQQQREQLVKEPMTKEVIVIDKQQPQQTLVKDADIKPKETSSNAISVQPIPAGVKEMTASSGQQPAATVVIAHDKKAGGQRKAETTGKAANIEASDSSGAPNPALQQQQQPQQQQQTVTQESNTNAKSKQNLQRSTPKQSQNVNQKAPQVTVSQPQPSKASNKSHKKNEINQKGANKEGTDMDAFNDNSPVREINANLTTNDINANLPPPQPLATATPIPIATNSVNNMVSPSTEPNNIINATNNRKLSESNDMAIKTAEPVAAAGKTIRQVDINDKVKEKPNTKVTTTKQFVGNIATENQDETDDASAAVVSMERMVQAKNEINIKAAASNENNLESKLPYVEGQWTPNNPKGNRRYHRDLLLAIRDLPASRRRPDDIPEVVLADDRGRLSDGRLSMGGRIDFSNPPFGGYGGKSGSQRGTIPKRNSQSKINDNRKVPTKPSVKISISVREDVKLHEAENAWRPARFNKGEFATEEDKKTEELYKKVRGVLNKLTPQKFDTLLSQIKGLKIDTENRLQGVIDLVFEKAVDEPNFSVAYALMCKELALMQVPTVNSIPDKPDFVNFRKLLINRCQVEFEKQSKDESVRLEKVKELMDCKDPEKKKDLQFELEEYDRKLRLKSVGNIRFIGELFKQNMLTVSIMLRCLTNLLENKDEESYECLCKLLTTIGKELESKGVDLSKILLAMKNITERKEAANVSSRIRFMLQDVIDLKASKWVPRRQDHNPKTIDQIQKEADQEQLNIQLMNSMSATPRKDDRSGGASGGGSGGGSGSGGGGGGTMDRKGTRGRNNPSDSEGWTISSRNRQTISVQGDKLKTKPSTMDETLGSSASFAFWGKGSAGSSNVKPQSLYNNNMYSALENIDTEKRSGRPTTGKDPYTSKGPSMERVYSGGKYEGRGSSRSGSQHRSNENPLQRGMAPPMSVTAEHQSVSVTVTAPRVAVTSAPVEPVITLTEDQLEKIQRTIWTSLDEFISGNCSEEDFFMELNTAVHVSYYAKMISGCNLRILESSADARKKTGSLFTNLLKKDKLQLEDYCTGLEDILSQADDLKIDIPKIWDYLAEILVDLLIEEVLPLTRLHKSFSILISQRLSSKALSPLFKSIVTIKGPHFLQSIWKKSGLKLEDFLDSCEISNFIRDNQLEFLCGGAAPLGQNQIPFKEVQSRLTELFKKNCSFDDVDGWIMANVGNQTKDPKFVRVLATAVFQDSIETIETEDTKSKQTERKYKLLVDRLTAHSKLLQKYVDNNSKYELQCLYALQALIHNLEQPQGLLLQFCENLYEAGTLSQESFLTWEQCNDPAEQEGKGVAIKQLTSFFIQMKEIDDELDENADDELAYESDVA